MKLNIGFHASPFTARRGARVLAAFVTPLLLVGGLAVGGAPVGAASTSSSWGGPYLVAPASTESPVISGVSCPTTTFCIAIDASGDTYTYGPFGSAPFIIHQSIDPYVNGNGNNMMGISCPTTTFCVAIDSQGYATIFNGTSWGTPTLLAGDGQGSVSLLSVSCPTTTFCAVSDSEASVILYQSGTWGSPQVIDPAAFSSSAPRLRGVSCASANDCWAVDDWGFAIQWDGTSWGTPQLIDDGYGSNAGNGESLTAVSCPTTTFCMATDSLGEAVTYDGTAWSFSGPGQVDPNMDTLVSISCASATFCITGINASSGSSATGAIIPYENGTWGSLEVINNSVSSGDVLSVSCPTTTFCAAGTIDGDMFVYSTPTPQIQVNSTRVVVKGNRIVVNVSCALAPCAGNVSLVGKVKSGSEYRTVVLAAGRYSLPLVGVKSFSTVALGLTPLGRKGLAHANKHAVSASLSATVQGGVTSTGSAVVS